MAQKNLKLFTTGITYVFSHYFVKIKVDSYDSLTIEKRLTLYNVIIHIKSVLKKDKNHYYYKNFLEIAKETFYAAKRPKKIFDVNDDNIVISKLVKAKTNSKYLIGYLAKNIRSLVLVMPKMSGYVKTFKVKEGSNK